MEHIINQDKKYILNLYKRININVKKAEGCYIYDNDDNKYLDMFGGIAVNSFGHNNKEIVKRITNQATKYIHLSNYFASEPVINLAKLLVENSFASKVFFSNSGTEANEAAIKLVRKYGKSFNDNKYEILTSTNSFHGRTCGGVSLTGQEKYKKDFKPLLPGIKHFNFNDIQDLKSKMNDNTCAVFLEIIQGEGGIKEVTKNFIDTLVDLSQKHNSLIVIDEIQSGLGRTGDLFAFEKYGITPDIVTLAKSLGGGIPIGAMLVNSKLENVFSPGNHGSTFGGNPLACCVGEYILTKITDKKFLNQIKENSKYMTDKLYVLKEKYPSIIKEIRGRGFMIGVDVGDYASTIKDKAFDQKLLINVTNTTVIRLLPPLIVTKEEIDNFLSIFDNILAQIK